MTYSIIVGEDGSEYVAMQFYYTTAEIEQSRFYGELSPSPDLAIPEPSTEMVPAVFRIVDGEARLLVNQAPPRARFPDPDSRLFRLSALEMNDGPS